LRESLSDEETLLKEIAGYLNFSNGTPDAGFQKNLNRFHTQLSSQRAWPDIRQQFLDHLDRLQVSTPTFVNSTQATAIVRLVFDDLWPAYRRHHADMLFHLDDGELQQPFFLARMFEAALAQGPPWDENQRIVAGAVNQLNDFIGFRPVAALENEQRMEPYEHERFRPVPLFIKGVGVVAGKYHDLISRTIRSFTETPAQILRDAHFDLSRMDELALDVRAHDHEHPVNKRTNYMFGEWDPHLIDTKGFYFRFVIRRIILDALLQWMDDNRDDTAEEVLHDASAVLCGTMLMASSISGSGPDTHDSTVTLTSLLPHVARQRDAFYDRLLKAATGARAKRLTREAKLTRQPFGHVRQALNMHLAHYGARQMQRRRLAQIFARMGYADASREQASVMPCASARFECEIQWRITTAHRDLDQGQLAEAANRIEEVENFLQRGIQCGALVDPWNILGYQGHFPLFSSREDVIPDQRVEALLDIMERLFGVYSHSLAETAAQGDDQLAGQLSDRFRNLADYWDQFATTAIEGLPNVHGRESWESATHVSCALNEWNAAGKAAGDISFWRKHVHRFESAKAYALVVDTLLQRQDHVAAMGLLMEWLSRADEVGLESSSHSIYSLLLEWMNCVIESIKSDTGNDVWPILRRLFDFLEANAGQYWSVPTADEVLGEKSIITGEPGTEESHNLRPDDVLDDDEDWEDQLYQAAYDGVVFHDSALDGHSGKTLDGGFTPEDSEFELVSRQLEPHLKFLMMLSNLWQTAASALAIPSTSDESRMAHAEHPGLDPKAEVIRKWHQHAGQLQSGLIQLMNQVWDHEITGSSGDHDSNVEYDLHLQTKFYLLHTIVTTHVNCRIAERRLLCCLPADAGDDQQSEDERQMVRVYRGVLSRNVAKVRQLLPTLLNRLSRKSLLYVPLDRGGHPQQILTARIVQADIRFLVAQLPRLGMLRETWHLLRTANRMERASRSGELAVTEFDRIFRAALRNSIEYIVQSSANWNGEDRSAEEKFPDEDLISVVDDVVERYIDQWLRHSRTMRLSPVESFQSELVLNDLKEFIAKYGEDLFHVKILTLGNVRAILHNGIEWFLEYLSETEDPLHRIRLLRDLENGQVDIEHAVDMLEMIYSSVVDKFDRYLEYNTTTTQSDYGEQFYCLLEFLRVESAYDRDDWNFVPLAIAHCVLTQCNKSEAVQDWETAFESKSCEMADGHLSRLKALEKKSGMHLPLINDRLNERFVKPLSVNRMLALAPAAMNDARQGRVYSESFAALHSEIDKYLDCTEGSGIDVPEWLLELEKKVNQLDLSSPFSKHNPELELQVPSIQISLQQLHQQLQEWNQPLSVQKSSQQRKRTSQKKGKRTDR